MSKRKSSQPHTLRSSMSFFSSCSSSSTPSKSLIAFYEDRGKDHRGRSQYEICQWGVGKLESSHDYIQTLFPLPEESGVNSSAPIIDREVFNAFRSRPELRSKLRESLRRMLWFYGFELKRDDSGVKVVKGANFDRNSENWDTRFDHNHLRITRIIRCLRVLGLEDEALAFFNALNETTTQTSDRSREFWRRAAERNLNIRPDLETDDEEDNSVGVRFLREYEKQRKAEASARGAVASFAEDKTVEANSEVKNAGIAEDQEEAVATMVASTISGTEDSSVPSDEKASAAGLGSAGDGRSGV